MKRQYVHLSKTKEEAIQVGKRKCLKPIILKVLARKAYNQKIRFFDMGKVVLAEQIPSDFIEFE